MDAGPLMDAAGIPFDAIGVGTEIQRRIGVKTSRDEPLARFTTMRVGGPADLYAAAHNVFELRALVKFARARAISHTLLGRGSNVVISDAGVRGLVIHVRAEGHEIVDGSLVAEAGLPMAKAATVTAEAGLAGLEFGLAIPGNVGGAVWANAGAHASDVAAVLETALVLGADESESRIDPAGLGLAYRDSRLKHPAAGAPAEVVLAATFRLRPDEPAAIRARHDEIRRWRREHQPLGIPSAGSVFRNPASGPSAGALIDACGLKGHRIGGAVVAERHANWILNDRGGSATDVRRLAEHVRATVERATGVRLAFEVVFLGDWSGSLEEGAP
ncbi:MAG TPA: UDP-N-acetylmuramate dehydrogenase [Patescibacteria group bacterium]|nr:UDP-N-acetylmuramate dehydrogenase [Patescibacteria group bacterium]